MYYKFNKLMSHLSERCKTDPDDENEIRNKRKQV